MTSTRETWSVPFAAAPGGAFEIEVALHPGDSGKLMFLLPGYDGDIDGYAGKYARIADLVQERHVATVVRTGNQPIDDAEFEESSVAQLRGVVTRARERANELCGARDPELFFMGFSAGASTMTALAGEFPRVTRLLLIAPSADAGEGAVRAGIASFAGELFVVVGEHDLVVGRRLPESLVSWATNARSKARSAPLRLSSSERARSRR